MALIKLCPGDGALEQVAAADALAELDQERAEAQAALAAAEAAMKAGSRDPGAFAQAKRARQDALDALERLEWAEKAERERQAAAEVQAKRDALREAQERAHAARARVGVIGGELGTLVATLVARVKELRALQAEVDRGAHFETFGVRDGYLAKQTLTTQLPVDADLPVTVLRVGRELSKVAGMSIQVAETKAAQGGL